jgi:DNA-directed RNA polymerase subunit RPC12/RpoP
MDLNADPEALAAAASLVTREWGITGYRVTDATSPGYSGAVLLTVRASDGGEFYVGATRYGTTVHGDDAETAAALLSKKISEESDPVYECAQCGTRTREAYPSEDGTLCAPCAHRQNERDEYGHGLAASTFGFLSETE